MYVQNLKTIWTKKYEQQNALWEKSISKWLFGRKYFFESVRHPSQQLDKYRILSYLMDLSSSDKFIILFYSGIHEKVDSIKIWTVVMHMYVVCFTFETLFVALCFTFRFHQLSFPIFSLPLPLSPLKIAPYAARLAGWKLIRRQFRQSTSMSSHIIHALRCHIPIWTHGIYTSNRCRRMIEAVICASWTRIQWKVR